MTSTPYFTIPRRSEFHDSDVWLDDLSAWLYVRDAMVRRNHPVSDGLIVTPAEGNPLIVYPGDTLVSDGGNAIRFATMQEEQELTDAAEPSEFELLFVTAGGLVEGVVITADALKTDEFYLMFLLNNKLVHALPHRNVIEFNEVSAHEGNVTWSNSEPTPLASSSEAQAMNRFMP